MNDLAASRRGLHGRTVEELGRRVVGGQWPAGTPLPTEDELAGTLGVSRTVVREAIKVLQAKGLVEVRPKTGTRVRPRRAWHLLDADVVSWLFSGLDRGEPTTDLRELQEVRATIEAAAARLAASRRTEEQLAEIEANERRVEAAWAEPIAHRAANLDFHGAVVDAAQNSFLSHVNALVRIALESAESISNGHGEPARAAAALRADVARAIRAGDAEGAEAAMRSLVALDRANMLEE
jgi:DNA-binding FadR family transcriptional regulator